MPREILDQTYQNVQEEVLSLGNMVEQATQGAITALLTRDLQASRRIHLGDQAINEKRFAIENAILVLIATKQPMAHDLRLLASMLEIITELERMGDYAKGIARFSLNIGERPIPAVGEDFTQMADLALNMLHDALVSFISEDAEYASAIPAQDDRVDEYYNRLYHKIVVEMINDTGSIDCGTYLLGVAHNLERLADRAVNICEHTIYIATGELVEISSSDLEETTI